MDKKNKNNSNESIINLNFMPYPSSTPLKIDYKNTLENKARKTSLFFVPKFSRNLSRFKVISQEQLIKLLSKNKKNRIDIENRMIADYLTLRFSYFYQIKISNKERFLKLISVLSLESTSSNEIIINIGEENNNFYVVLEGVVKVSRKIIYKKDMTFGDFCEYLKRIEKENVGEYRTNIKNNSYLDLDFEKIMKDELSYMLLKFKLFNFTIEEEEEIGTYSEGYSFGELSLIKKKNTDLIIKSVTKCKLISVSKFDFNRILRTLEEKRLEKKADIFKNNFPIFKTWQIEQLITLFNYFTQEIFPSEEYIYKQNDEDEYVYFIEEGSITQYTNVSFHWYIQFNEYIDTLDESLLEIIKDPNHHNTGELHIFLNKYIKEMKEEKNEDRAFYDRYPFFKIKEIYKQKKDIIKLSEMCSYDNKNKNKYEDNFYKIKYDENDINNPEKVHKIHIITFDKPCILGAEEAFELKRKFTTIKCISGQVRAKKIKIIDLLKVLFIYRSYNYIENFKDIIFQKKSIICDAIKTNMQKIAIQFQRSMNDRYEKMTQYNISSYRKKNKNTFSNDIKKELIISTKLQSWDNCPYLDNVLDTSLHLINPKTERKIKLQKNLKYENINRLFKTKRSPNEKIFYSTKCFISKIFDKNILNMPPSNKKKFKLKQFLQMQFKDIKKPKKKISENCFNTSTKKKVYESRNRKVNFEDKKNEDKVYMKTCDNLLRRKKVKILDKPNIINIKKESINVPKLKNTLKKFINYKVSEDYFDNIDNNEDDIDNKEK